MKNEHKARWLIVAVALFAAVAGVIVNRQGVLGAANQPSASSRLLNLRMLDAHDKSVTLAQWRGKPMLINFWGTWCPPCREEMPLLDDAAKRYGPRGVQFVGISIDDPQAVRSYLAQHSISYPLLLGSFDLLGLTTDLGNTAQTLPFSVILRADGSVEKTKLGAFNAKELDQELDSLLGAR
ncbi:MAG TPA: TlpA disulfide reductase family protein [Rhodocyclaceae bacterium]|nr:TlpA disulfide reductase family protein [Rhodocyclaceae bacterium]